MACLNPNCKGADFEWAHNSKHFPRGYSWATWNAKRAAARLWTHIDLWQGVTNESLERQANHLWWLTAPEPPITY